MFNSYVLERSYAGCEPTEFTRNAKELNQLIIRLNQYRYTDIFYCDKQSFYAIELCGGVSIAQYIYGGEDQHYDMQFWRTVWPRTFERVRACGVNCCNLLDFERIMDANSICSLWGLCTDLSTSCHSNSEQYLTWRIETLREHLKGSEFWQLKEQVLPHLCFSPDLQSSLHDRAGALFKQIMDDLYLLDSWAASWNEGAFRHDLLSAVGLTSSGESESVRNNSAARSERTFRVPGGGREFFADHIKGCNFRIYFKALEGSHEVVVGYVFVPHPKMCS